MLDAWGSQFVYYYPFIPGDLLKIALAAVLLPTVWKYVERMKQ